MCDDNDSVQIKKFSQCISSRGKVGHLLLIQMQLFLLKKT